MIVIIERESVSSGNFPFKEWKVTADVVIGDGKLITVKTHVWDESIMRHGSEEVVGSILHEIEGLEWIVGTKILYITKRIIEVYEIQEPPCRVRQIVFIFSVPLSTKAIKVIDFLKKESGA